MRIQVWQWRPLKLCDMTDFDRPVSLKEPAPRDTVYWCSSDTVTKGGEARY
jgi:hypothetical protein